MSQNVWKKFDLQDDAFYHGSQDFKEVKFQVISRFSRSYFPEIPGYFFAVIEISCRRFFRITWITVFWWTILSPCQRRNINKTIFAAQRVKFQVISRFSRFSRSWFKFQVISRFSRFSWVLGTMRSTSLFLRKIQCRKSRNLYC